MAEAFWWSLICNTKIFMLHALSIGPSTSLYHASLPLILPSLSHAHDQSVRPFASVHDSGIFLPCLLSLPICSGCPGALPKLCPLGRLPLTAVFQAILRVASCGSSLFPACTHWANPSVNQDLLLLWDHHTDLLPPCVGTIHISWRKDTSVVVVGDMGSGPYEVYLYLSLMSSVFAQV
jgi:hypothetical protein